jgi:hypothetical protein
MIPAMRNQTNRLHVLFGLLVDLARLSCFFFPPSGEPLLLVAVVGTGLFLVSLTLVAVEKENLLRVAGTHIDSFRIWAMAVKRTTMSGDGKGCI